MRNHNSKAIACSMVVSIFLGSATMAQAQEATMEETASDSQVTLDNTTAKAKPTLDEVVVTAQKRVEDVQDIPMSVTAIGAESIKRQNINDLNNIGHLVPNLEITATPAFNFITMRGTGSGNNRGFEQSVAIIIDEIYYGRPAYLSTGMMDVAAIEVLRGPQGTLYGKNSVAGTLHIRTGTPEDEWGMDADALYGDHNQQRYRIALTGPILEDRLAFRFAAGIDKKDGDIENTTTGEMISNRDNFNARLKLKYDFDAPVDVTLSLNYLTTDQVGDPVGYVFLQPRHLAAQQVFDPQASADPADEKLHKDSVNITDREAYDATLTLNWDIQPGLSLVSVSNMARLVDFVDFDGDFGPIPMLTLLSNEEYMQFSQEIRVTGDWKSVSYIGGLYFFHNNMKVESDTTLLLETHEALLVGGGLELTTMGRVCDPIWANSQGAAVLTMLGGCRQEAFALDNALAGQLGAELARARLANAPPFPIEQNYYNVDQTTTTYAAFGQFTWSVTPKIDITVGNRFSYEIKEIEAFHELYNLRPGGSPGRTTATNPNGAIVFTIIQPENEPYNENRKRVEFDLSPKISGQYFFTEDVMTYVTVAKGFKSGGFSATSNNAANLEFDEEESLNYEVGLRSEFFDRRIRVNISAFYTDYDGLQITSITGNETFITNAPKTIIKGIEFDYAIAVAPFLILTGNGAITNARYEEFRNGPCPVLHDGTKPCDLSGKRLPLSPDYSWTQNLLSFVPLGNFALLQLGLTATYKSDMFQAIDLDPKSNIPAAWRYRGQLSLRDIDEQWAISFFIENPFDEFYSRGSSDAPAFTGSYIGGTGSFRTISGEIRVKF